jgi:putative copper export protein
VQAAPLIEWPEPIYHLVDFIGLFLSAGAIGFRFSSLRGKLGAQSDATPRTGAPDAVAADATMYGAAARRAAVFGLVGALIVLIRVFQNLPEMASRAHTTTSGLLSSNIGAQTLTGFAVLAVIGFLLASMRIAAGWPIAAASVVIGTLNAALSGQWARLVNPIHALAAGLWIGTLFIMLVVGIALVLRGEVRADRRGPIVADMVNGFSPLALTCGMIVVIFGLITAWKHLNPLSSLWTTPYGWALLAKLAVVAVVFALGAWNWKRGRAALGSEAGAVAIRRSARSELLAAGVVLLITTILVTLPSPRRPGAGPGGPGVPPPAAPAGTPAGDGAATPPPAT